MKKKLFLLSIILFPSLIYLFFEMTKANFKKMAYFGPKKVIEKGDTVYYSIPETYFLSNLILKEEICKGADGENIKAIVQHVDSTLLDTTNFPVYVILFTDSQLKKEGYKLSGIYDFMKYKMKDLKDVPVFIASRFSEALGTSKLNKELRGDFDSLKIVHPNFHPLLVDYEDRQKFLSETYFKQKPLYVFDYFMVLVDKQRHIRGYYDPTFNAEITRMIADYKHLKIRDGYAQTQRQNAIKQN